MRLDKNKEIEIINVWEWLTSLQKWIEATKHRLEWENLVNSKNSKKHIRAERYDLKLGHITSEEVQNTKKAIEYIRDWWVLKNNPANNGEVFSKYA